ncbi:LacI family DNA-binding transcriptional regulator [Streptomyces albiflaviniger]|nr:LacI family DNA-binding transcriptional regulator [Streptomyces albiflaviniger]
MSARPGVSVATVPNVLNRSGLVAVPTRERVQRAIGRGGAARHRPRAADRHTSARPGRGHVVRRRQDRGRDPARPGRPVRGPEPTGHLHTGWRPSPAPTASSTWGAAASWRAEPIRSSWPPAAGSRSRRRCARRAPPTMPSAGTGTGPSHRTSSRSAMPLH